MAEGVLPVTVGRSETILRAGIEGTTARPRGSPLGEGGSAPATLPFLTAGRRPDQPAARPYCSAGRVATQGITSYGEAWLSQKP